MLNACSLLLVITNDVEDQSSLSMTTITATVAMQTVAIFILCNIVGR